MRLACPHFPALPARPCRVLLVVLLVVAGAARPMPSAYSTPADAVIRGFVAGAVQRTRLQEARLSGGIDADALAALAQQLGKEPAIAGTESMRRASDWLRRRLSSWGLRVEVRRYEVFMPHARRVRLSRVQPRPADLALGEREARGDPDKRVAAYPAAAGYSAAGDVTAPVIYVNYGRAQDFALLRALGVSVQDRIVMVRHGQVFRGAKVANAEAAGAAAMILYSDPADDGYRLGRVYPDGPFRPPSGIQRGSVKIGPPGDPTTPGWASLPGAVRVVPRVPRIPVISVGYATADELLRYLDGPPAPPAWQGGLARSYRIGQGALSARVSVQLEARSMRPIYDTVAYLDGTTHSRAWVIVGAHRDTWSNGAVDNVSGTASVLEAARAMAALAAQGERPRRTIVFAFWDAEEWGLIGSGEWVEEHEARLREDAVAYINQDSIAGGPYFEAVASPSLARLLLEVADDVEDPVEPGRSVLEGWRRRTPGATVTPPAGGSDYASFAGRAGVPSMGFGFAGAAGVYHSAYDTRDFVRRFGDPGYRQHQAASRLVALAAWRLANADLVPTRLTDLATELDSRASIGARHLQEYRLIDSEDAARLLAATHRFRRAAASFQLHADGRLRQAAANTTPLDRLQLARLNAAVRSVAGILAAPPDDPGGSAARGPGSEWFRNRLLAADLTNPYQSLWLPGLVAAASERDRDAVQEQLGDLLWQLQRASDVLVDTVTAPPVVAPTPSGS